MAKVPEERSERTDQPSDDNRQTDAPPPSAPPELTAILREGLTKGGEATLGLSILSDVLDELLGIGALIGSLVESEALVPVLDGVTLRLNAALRVLRLEHEER